MKNAPTPIKRPSSLLAILFVLTGTSLATPGEIAPSPHLFFELEDLPAIRERIASSDWLTKAFEYARYEAEVFLDTQTRPYSLTSETTRGIRGNGIGSAGRPVQHRLATLAMAGYISGQQPYLDKGKEILLAVVRQTEPDTHKHWIKHLQSADAAQGIAYGYDFFGHLLSPDENAEVREYLEKIGQFLVDEDTTWGKPALGVTSCNHNSVHHGALGLVALVLGEKPQWLDLARKRVRAYFETFTDATGYATEGHQYFGYGLSGALPFSFALQRMTGEKLWDTQPALPLVGDQIVWKLLPFDGRMVAMNDNNDGPTDPSGILPALMYNKGVQLWAFLNGLDDYDKGFIKANGALGSAHGSHLLYLTGEQPVDPIHPAEAGLPLGHRFESGRVFLRSSWEGEDAAHVSFTSGYDFHRGHNHHDENALTFAALGEAFLIDPGYNPKWVEQHTVLTIDGVGQITGGRGRLVEYLEDAYGAFVRGQAEEAYDFEAEVVGMADRKVYFVRGPSPYLVWRDDMASESDRHLDFISRYITDPKNRLHQKGKSLVIEGYRDQAKCLLQVYSNGRQIPVTADNLETKTFPRRGKNEPYLKYLRRASARVKAHNPRLLSIALPYLEADELPGIEVRYNEDADEISCTLNFPDGHADTLVFGLEDVSFLRK